MTDIMVSVVCPTYNHRSFLNEAIDSFLAQEAPFSIEILVHDDASTDGTDDIVRDYARRHPDTIVPILQPENVYSRGTKPSSILFPRCNGKYIAFCEGDDFWSDPRKLEKQVAFMERYPDCSMVYHPSHQYDESAGKLSHVRNKRAGTEFLTDREVIVGRGDFYPSASAMFRRSAMVPHFLALAHLRVPGDHLFAVAALCGGTVGYMDECMATFRRNAGSITQSYKYNLDLSARARHREQQPRHLLAAFEFIDGYTEGKFRAWIGEAIQVYLWDWTRSNISMLRMNDADALNRPYLRFLNLWQRILINARRILKMSGFRWRV